MGRKPAAAGVGRRRRKAAGSSFRRILQKWLRSARSGVVSAFGMIRRATWAFAWRLTIVLTLMVAGATFYYHAQLPPATAYLDARTRGSVTISDRDGRIFAWRGQQYGGAVTVDTVSPHLLNAVIATEDRRFYRHFGVSPRGILGAMLINLREGRAVFQGHGGSTITQQVGKLLCLGKEYDHESDQTQSEFERDCRRSTLWRKLKEVPFAFALEIKYSKDEILMIYFNRSYLGAGATGFEAASQRYFGKPVSQVEPAEAAMLAGLLAAPSRYAPTRNIAKSRQRASVIISQMEDAGFLSSSEAAAARNAPASLSSAAAHRIGGHFADWAMDSVPAFLARRTTEDVVMRTTFDRRIQRAADEALAHVFENLVRPGSRAQAAIIVMSPDGAVRAVVGGRATDAIGQFNRATRALRQTGSLFKPFVYAAALEAGYRFDDEVVDQPLAIRVPGSGIWRPKNYKDGFEGRMSLTDAFAQSVNTVAARLTVDVGVNRVRDVARKFGLDGDLAEGPAIALGVSEATLLEMTGAYAGLLAGGRQVQPYGIVDIRLRFDDAPLIERQGGYGERAISDSSARQLVYMMSRVVADGTGRRAWIDRIPVAGKTGTTQEARDAWFIGFSADHVIGVWMGYDDNTPLTGVVGGGLPAEIWRETMQRIAIADTARPLPMINPDSPFDRSLLIAGSRAPDEGSDGVVGSILRWIGVRQ